MLRKNKAKGTFFALGLFKSLSVIEFFRRSKKCLKREREKEKRRNVCAVASNSECPYSGTKAPTTSNKNFGERERKTFATQCPRKGWSATAATVGQELHKKQQKKAQIKRRKKAEQLK